MTLLFEILVGWTLFAIWGLIGSGLAILFRVPEKTITTEHYYGWFIFLAGPGWWFVWYMNKIVGCVNKR